MWRRRRFEVVLMQEEEDEEGREKEVKLRKGTVTSGWRRQGVLDVLFYFSYSVCGCPLAHRIAADKSVKPNQTLEHG